MASETYHCDGCGLCCKHLIIEAAWHDVLREPRIGEECKLPPKRGTADHPLTVLESSWVLNDRATLACHFLGDDNRCGIYATRPLECLAFPAGGEKCRELREDHGLPPLIARAQDGSVVDEILAEASVAEFE